MHLKHIALWQHQHIFNSDKKHIEARTWLVVIITFITMVAEVFFGWFTNSMALLADGWHMGTHTFALGISLMAYIFARKYIKDRRFTFGTWKIEILGAYSSALLLGLVGLMMVYMSIERLMQPLSIHYNQALYVTMIGLVINLVCAIILGNRTHWHNHDAQLNISEHADLPKVSQHPEDDLNYRTAYLHVVADALTSVFAIVALLGAKFFNAIWLDPLMGIVGAGLIIRWAAKLLKDSSGILLDCEVNAPLSNEIKELIESDGNTKISDLHLWNVADQKYACILSLVTNKKYSIEDYRKRLTPIRALAHVTVEINQCSSAD